MDDYGFWLYSAMTQATAALFGVIGMFIIFKLQSLKDAIKDKERGILDALQRLGLNYSALEKKPFKEIEEILLNQIKQRQEIEKVPNDEASRLLIDKEKGKREATFLESREKYLRQAQIDYSSLVKNGKETMKGLGFIFGFSVILLILKPLLEKGSFIFLTVLYVLALVIISISIWRLMKETLT